MLCLESERWRRRGRHNALCILTLIVALVPLSSCTNESTPETSEYTYSSEALGEIRDQLGPKSRVIATIGSGERLMVLERLNRWARIRVVSNGGEGKPPLEGWMHQRQMVTQ